VAITVVRMTEVRFLMTEVRIMYVRIGMNPFFLLVFVPSFPGPRVSMGLINQIKVVIVVLTKRVREKSNKATKVRKRVIIDRRFILVSLDLMSIHLCASSIFYVTHPSTVVHCTVVDFTCYRGNITNTPNNIASDLSRLVGAGTSSF
jgi:hypothetical protein